MSKDELVAKINAVAPLIVALLGFVNAFLTLRGLPSIQIGDEAITVVISGIAGIVGEFWGWWRNNNWTKEAQIVQPVLNELKAGTITDRQVESILEK